MPKHKCLKKFTEAQDLGADAYRSVRGAGRPVISPLSAEEKKNLAYSLGVPAEGSGVPGAWQYGDEDRVVAIPFTDESVDRHGTAFLSSGWEFSEYLRNPVFLDGHDQEKPPLGMTLAISPAAIKGKGGESRSGYVAHVLFSREDLNPNAELVYRNWIAGRVRGSSVGFRPLEIRPAKDEEAKALEARGEEPDAWIISRAELLEISAVTVPSNPSAVQRNVLAQEVKDMAKLSQDSGLFSRSDLELLYGVRALAEAIDAEGLKLPEKRETMSSEELLSFAKLADSQEEIEIDETTRQVPETAEEETRSPACRMDGETVEECVSRKVPEILSEDEDMGSDQAVAIANSMCETACSEKSEGPQEELAKNIELLERLVEQTESVPEEVVISGQRYLKADPEMEAKLQVLADVRDLAARLTANEELRGEGLFGALQLLKEEVTALREEVAEIRTTSGKEPNDEPVAPKRDSDLYNRLLDLQSKLITVTE